MRSEGPHSVAALLGGSQEQTARLENFVWLHLAQFGQDAALWNSSTFPESACYMVLMGNSGLLQHLKTTLKVAWIPDRDFSWLAESDRQEFWVQQYVVAGRLAMSFGDPAMGSPRIAIERIPPHMRGRSRCIALLDYWSSCVVLDMLVRRQAVQRMQVHWLHQVKTDRTYDWLDGEGSEARRDQFWVKLRSKTLWVPFETLAPVSHDDLLHKLGQLKAHPAEIREFNQTEQKRYRQQLRREATVGKRQCNFVLDEGTIAKLDSLAKRYGLSRTEVIQVLIQSEAATPRHIPDRLQRKMTLLGPTS